MQSIAFAFKCTGLPIGTQAQSSLAQGIVGTKPGPMKKIAVVDLSIVSASHMWEGHIRCEASQAWSESRSTRGMGRDT